MARVVGGSARIVRTNLVRVIAVGRLCVHCKALPHHGVAGQGVAVDRHLVVGPIRIPVHGPDDARSARRVRSERGQRRPAGVRGVGSQMGAPTAGANVAAAGTRLKQSPA